MSRIGLTMGPVCVLTVPGRRTGKPRSTPVSPLTVSGGRYMVAGLPDSDWARNVRAAGHAQLSRGRRREPVTVTEVTDSKLKEQVMRAYPREVPRGAPMFVRAPHRQQPRPRRLRRSRQPRRGIRDPPGAASAVKLRHRRDAPQNRAGCQPVRSWRLHAPSPCCGQVSKDEI
jgi:deazaflavin-dependent oxidoreductase (nitroreductase family)